MDSGTSNSISSVVRVMVGTIIMAKATPPAKAEKCFWRKTTMLYATMPITMEATPLSTSDVKRMKSPKRFRPYSAK